MTENIYQSLMSYEWDNINYHYLNRYINFVNSILEKRENKRFEHSERHHICPRALNGTDDADNLIYLSYREHFLAHYMLAKSFPKHIITFALTRMMDGKERIKNSRMYEQAKILVSEAVSTFMKGKMVGEKNPFYGKKHPPELMEQIRQKLIGKHHSIETRIKMSEQRKGENHPNWGKHLSEETKRHISEAKKGKAPNMSKEVNQKRIEKIQKSHIENHTKNKLMNDGVNTIFVPLNEVDEYLRKGYVLGRPKLSEETKRKITEKARERFLVKGETNIKLSNAAKNRYKNEKIFNKGTKLMNNGIINKYVPIDEIEYYQSLGFVFGKIKKD